MSFEIKDTKTKHYNHVVEIGAGDSYSSMGLSMLEKADKVTLYEPNRLLFNDLVRVKEGRPTLTVHPWAVGMVGMENAPLIHLGYASYLWGAPSFVKLSIEENGEDWLNPLVKTVRLAGMEEVDDGKIDYLILTNNGCELPVLQSMKSRPEVVHTKHFIHNEAQGKQAGVVCQWLHGQGYRAHVLETNQYQTFHHLVWQFTN